ncbi:winged helix-turn-helix transcriptional regulator (plasmid) [Salinirubellus salinus]|uniref:Winged helix-turn-helix transcriptional regulator n=1 Tax=Salinirubellus salinus TaxID=1364945 RepID=A0A9E7R9C1_9EURY|nr:winged helix-turn-helix transcriptional regulator [Salinirubellus salinus]UWM56965.1 winged helix-turn-helix transcriptional regulator [Salinirubellus salinus]
MTLHPNQNPADSVALELLGTKWKPQIIVQLHEHGATGFGGLKDRLGGISNKVLSNNVDDLIERDVLHKEVLQESPRRVEYTLTPAGDDLYALIAATADWDNEYVESRGLPRVLVVDDDPRQVELLSSWLGTEYEVVTATDGDSARKALDDSIDVAIIDRHLPDMTGDQIVENARRVGICPPTAFLSSADVSVAATELPVDMLLSKPAKHDELLDAVNLLYRMNELSALGRKIQAREHRHQFVRETQGPAVVTTPEYEQAEVELEALRAEWEEELEDRDAWRSLSDADSIDELLADGATDTDD